MQELRDAYRSLRSTPLVTAVAVLSLALGIGASSAIFSLLNAILLRPLSVRDSHQLVMVTSADNRRSAWPQPVWTEIRDRQLLDGAFAWFWNRFDTAQGGERQFVDGMAASGRMFESLGLRPIIGRLLTPGDDEVSGGSGESVAVITYRFWQRRFGGAADVLGRSIRIEGRPFRVIGVTPPEFVGLYIGLPVDLVIPLGRPATTPGGPSVIIMGRLKPGQNADAATSALRTAQPQIRDATNPYTVAPYRDEYLRTPFTARAARGGVSFLQRRYEHPFKTLFAIVGLVLLIACGNIAMLLLARAMGRRHEMTVRASLGASRVRLARHVAAESLLLAAAGVSFGMLVAQWCTYLVVSQLSTEAYTVFLDLRPDWRVLTFTTALGLATALLFGAAPALHAMRADPMDALKQRSDLGGRRFGFGSAIVVMQVALSLMLAVGTGLFLRTILALAAIDVGFEPDRVLVVTVDAGRSAATTEQRGALYDRVNRAVTATDGVTSAGLSVAMPGGNSAWNPWIELPDGTALPQGPNGVYANRITAGWFRTLGTTVLAGREFDAGDRTGAPGVVVVNEAFVREFLKDKQPLGRTMFQRTDAEGPRQPLEIVGIVQNAMYRFLKESPPPTIYTPVAQMADPLPATVSLSVRSREGPTATLPRNVAQAIGRVDRDISLTFRTLSDQVNAQYAQERLVAGVATFFGALALLIAALGLYGVTAYAVTRRRFEIGVRMALGATAASIMRLVVARVWMLVGGGMALGLVGSLWTAPLIRSMLYGVEPLDTVTFGAAFVVLFAVAALAGLLPARRATRVDPLRTLRAE